MKVAAPAINKTIEAHIRNINEAESNNLSNKYVEESKRQILLTSNILGQELEKIVYTALDNFKDITNGDLPSLIEKGYDATNSEGLNYYGLDEDANQMIDYAREVSNTAIDSYSNTLKMAKDYNIKSDLIRNTQDRLLRFAVEVSDECVQTSGAWHELGSLHGMNALSGAEYPTSGQLYLKEARKTGS